VALLLWNRSATHVARNTEDYGVGAGEGSSLDFFDLSDFSVFELDSVLVALSDFLEAASVLFFSLVLLVLVLGEVALSAAGLVALVADSAGLFAVEAGAVAVAAGLVVAGVADALGASVGDGFATVALAEGVVVAAGVVLAAGVAAAGAVAAGVALALVDALVLEVVVAPVVVPEVEVTPTLKFGTVTP
jgi:hypothetical protein